MLHVFHIKHSFKNNKIQFLCSREHFNVNAMVQTCCSKCKACTASHHKTLLLPYYHVICTNLPVDPSSPKITTIMNITRSAKLSDVPSRQVVIVNIAVTVNCRPHGVHLSALLGKTRSKVGERGNVIAIGRG